MAELPAHVALLAPVPLEHLISGRAICDLHGKVAFGSNAFDALHKLTQEADGAPCEALIYASEAHRPGPPRVAWKARFLRWVHAKAGAHPEGSVYRPPSTVTDTKWAMYWEVSDLQELPASDHLLISSLKPIGKNGTLANDFVPLGPLVVQAL